MRSRYALAAIGMVAATATFGFAGVATAAGPPLAGILDTSAPESLDGCSGALTADPTLGTDWYDYTFSCTPAFSVTGYTGNVLAYSFVVGRAAFDGRNVASNNAPAIYVPGPNAADPTAGQTLYASGELTEAVTCNVGGESDGFNCSGGVPSATNAGYVPAGDLVEGSLQLTAPYCSYLPAHAKAGTPAVPRAVVDLIVTDASGAEDGPFELAPTARCPKVPAVVPKHKRKSKRHAHKAGKEASRK